MLGNYKIRVNNEAESREAQELFFKLGYRIGACTMKGFPYLIVTQKDYSSKCSDLNSFKRHKEITLSKLKDMVVLHRNDVNDATHVGNYCGDFYVTCDGDIYSWEGQGVWEENNYNTMNDIKPIQTKPAEKRLISSADAKLAWAKGNELQIRETGTTEWKPLTDKYSLMVFDYERYELRLKPRTITLNVEIPAPFEPKDGDVYWHISPVNECGYKSKTYQEEFNSTQFGAWRTEEEIKQVVAALRGEICKK